jgi:hypothetical protein
MKLNIAVATALAALSVNLSSAAHAQQTMRPGLWEFTINMTMPGGKKAGTQTRKHQQCITPEQVKDKSAFNSQMDPKMGCSMSDFKQDGSKFSYKLACTGQLKMTGTASGAATPDAMTMNTEMDMSAMKGAGVIKQAITGRRLGECTT